MPEVKDHFDFEMRAIVKIAASGKKGVVTNRSIDRATEKNRYQLYVADGDPMIDWYFEDELSKG